MLVGGGDHLLLQWHCRVKTLPSPPGLRGGCAGWVMCCRVAGGCWKAEGIRAKGWSSSWCRKACAQEQLCKERQLHLHGRKQTGLFSSTDSTWKLPPPRWALQGARFRAWVQKALCSCSDLHTFINSGTMFTLSFPTSAYKQRPRIIKTVLILLYSAGKPDVKQENIKFLRDSVRWVTLL